MGWKDGANPVGTGLHRGRNSRGCSDEVLLVPQHPHAVLSAAECSVAGWAEDGEELRRLHPSDFPPPHPVPEPRGAGDTWKRSRRRSESVALK